MFTYARNVKLATSDKVRRAGIAVGAGVLLAIAAGFLLAALWSYLAYSLGWGAVAASLVIGVAMLALSLILFSMARTERHPMPSVDDLRHEVGQQMNLMANSAINKASDAAESVMDHASVKAGEVLGLAENKAHAVADDLSYRANRMADRAEARAYGAARDLGENAARGLGLKPGTRPAGDEARQPGRASLAPYIGALAVGITIASRLQGRRNRDRDRG